MHKNEPKTEKKKPTFVRKQLTMLALVLALVTAVYLNWRLADGNGALPLTELVNPTAAQGEAVPSEYEEEADETGKNYGDALFVSAEAGDNTSYFADARLARTTARDEALDTLQRSLQQTDLTEAEKNALTEKLTAVAADITREGTIESLVKAKGFSDCVAYLSDGAAKVVVACENEGLTAAQAAQIKEIIIAETGISAGKITIVEVQ